MAPRPRLAAALLALLAAAASAAAGEGPAPLGPPFGDNAYHASLRDDGARDVDDFPGLLAAGESLTVEVRAAAGSGLRPDLVLLDPDGADRTPPLRRRRDGAVVAFRRAAADRTGTWVVRVLGREDDEGAYAVRFRVHPAPGGTVRRRLLGGPAPRVAVLPFEALPGARLSLALRGLGRGEAPPFLEVLDPDGAAVPALGGLLDREAGTLLLRDLPLEGRAGTWRILAGVDDREAALRLAWRVAPPERLRGTRALDDAEPALDPPAAPVEGTPGAVVRLRGRGLSTWPFPRVLLGGAPAEVLAVGASGTEVDVRLPRTPGEEPLDAAVVNPDGQACAVAAAVRVVLPGPARLRSVEPVPLRVTGGEAVTITVRLTAPAPVEGAAVALAVEGADASVPAEVRVPPWGTSATATLVAGTAAGTGRLVASLGATVEVPVTILPPPPPEILDLSGWSLVQTDSARTLVLPEGTRLARGAVLVVARDAPRATFETFWGALGPGALYIDSGDLFPSLNGAETFTLRDRGGAVVDGPSLALVAGRCRKRKAPVPASEAAAWEDLPAVPGEATPGWLEYGAGDGAVRITEIADPAGSGQFPCEFVEIGWDAE